MVEQIKGNNTITAFARAIVAQNESDRLNNFSPTRANVGITCFQLDTLEIFYLANNDPVTWVPLRQGSLAVPIVVTGSGAIPAEAEIVVVDLSAGDIALTLPRFADVPEGKSITVVTSNLDFSSRLTLSVDPADVSFFQPPIDENTNEAIFDIFTPQVLTLTKVTTVGDRNTWRSTSMTSAVTSRFAGSGGTFDVAREPYGHISELNPAGTPIGPLGSAGNFGSWTTAGLDLVYGAPYITFSGGDLTVGELGPGVWEVTAFARILGSANAIITPRIVQGLSKFEIAGSRGRVVFGATPVEDVVYVSGQTFATGGENWQLQFASSINGDTVTLFDARMSAKRLSS